jgi:hypothetical protein
MTVNAYVYLSTLMDYVKKLERGDSDSAGSTLRTMGIVTLVLAFVVIIGVAVVAAANYIAGQLQANPFSF